MSGSEFNAGTTVLAKLKGFPAWPAVVVRVSDLPDNVRVAKPKKKDVFPVMFYNEVSFMWATSAELRVLSSEEAKSSYQKGAKLKKSLREAFKIAIDPPEFQDLLPKSKEPEPEPAPTSRRRSSRNLAKAEPEPEPEAISASRRRSSRNVAKPEPVEEAAATTRRRSSRNVVKAEPEPTPVSTRKRKAAVADPLEDGQPPKSRRTSARAPAPAASSSSSGRRSARSASKEPSPVPSSSPEAEDEPEFEEQAGSDSEYEGEEDEDDAMDEDDSDEENEETKQESDHDDEMSGLLPGDLEGSKARILLQSLKTRGRQPSKKQKPRFASDQDISKSSELKTEFCKQLRSELQQAFLHDDPLDESQLAKFVGYFKQLKNIDTLEISLVRSTKLNKAIRLVTEREDLPEAAVKIVEACKEALELWNVPAEPIIRGRPEEEFAGEDEEQEADEAEDEDLQGADAETMEPKAETSQVDGEAEEPAGDDETKPAEQPVETIGKPPATLSNQLEEEQPMEVDAQPAADEDSVSNETAPETKPEIQDGLTDKDDNSSSEPAPHPSADPVPSLAASSAAVVADASIADTNDGPKAE